MEIDNLLTVKEAAARLGVTPARIRQFKMASDGRLIARKATPEEARLLVGQGRVKRVPHTGVLVIHPADLARVQIDYTHRRSR